MSSDFTNNKGKRKRSADRNADNSFVKSMTKKVSALLPSTITKWFSSSSMSNVNGTTSVDATDSSTDDEDAPVGTAVKRMRFSSPGQHSQFNRVDANFVTNTVNVNEPTSVPYSAIKSPLNKTPYLGETNIASTSLKSPNAESFAEKSEQDSSSVLKMHHSVSSIGQLVAKQREPIFKSTSKSDTSKAKSNQTYDQPCFKPSLLSSSFYSGRTMYGGASASHVNEAQIKTKNVAHINKSNANDTTTMSHSSRKILDLLENYSSPLIEARRIPPYVKSPNTNHNSTKSTLKGKDAYKTQELFVPSIASILKWKQRSRLMDTTSVARQLIASHSSTMGISPYPISSNKHMSQNKDESDTQSSLRDYRLKTKLTRQNRGVDPATEVSPPVILPKATLQISPDNLPSFTFKSSHPPTSTPYVASTIHTSTPKSSAKESETINVSSDSKKISKSLYEFSKPDSVVFDITEHPKSKSNFLFGSPEREVDKVPATTHFNDKQEPVTQDFKKDVILSNMLNEWKCSDCWVSNKSNIDKCECCGSKRPTVHTDNTLKCSKCKVADAQNHIDTCVNCEKHETKHINTSPQKSKETTTWKCNDCWVNNDNNLDKCACCGASNSMKTVTNIQVSTVNTSESNWKCGDCLILNKDGLEKCAGCGALKTPELPKDNKDTDKRATITSVSDNVPLFSTVTPRDDDFMNIVKSQSDKKWDCRCCMVKNDIDKNVCICCNAKRQDTKNPDKNNKIQFNFTVNEEGPQFKFGIAHNEPKETIIDNIMEEESLPEVPNIINFEANNINLNKVSAFSDKIREDKIVFPNVRNEETASTTVNYEFVLPKQTDTLPAIITQPDLTANSEIEKEKPQLIPQVDFSLDQNKNKPITGLYTSTDESSIMPKTVSVLSSDENKETPGNSLTLPSYSQSVATIAPQSLPVQSAFKFSASKLNLSSNPFNNSGSTAAVTTTSFETVPTTKTSLILPVFQKPEDNTALSLFSKKDNDIPTTNIPLFQKNIPAVTTSQNTTVSTTPVFSFGPYPKSNSPGTEQSKFKFVFGSNTGESSPFKPPSFGTTSNSNLGSNKFTFTSGKTLGPGNGLFGNVLGGDGLTSGNTLASAKLTATHPLVGSTEVSTVTQTVSGNNGLQTNNTITTTAFGTPGQKDNMWSSKNNSSNNLFVPISSANTTIQKAAPFTFGTLSPFNANNPAPTFGSSTQTTPNVFGMPNQTVGGQPALFSNPTQNQTMPVLFGNTTPANNVAPSINTMFGTPNIGVTSTFGNPNPSIPTFETPTLSAAQTPTPVPAFNFSAQPSLNVRSFGQQQQQQQQIPQPGVYNFGSSNPSAPQLQFNIGSAPNTTMRRVRKAVRRNPQR